MFAKAKAAVGNMAQMNSMCSQSSLAPHQVVVYEIAKLMASVPPERLGEHRALLTYHSTGSGKTISSLAIIFAFWNTDKKIVLVSSKSNTDQALASYVREAPRFFPAEYKAIAEEYKKHGGAPYLGDHEAFGSALYERVNGLTFRMARNRIAAKPGEFKTVKEVMLDSGEGSVLIIDEAQGLSMRDKTDPGGDAIRLGCALRSLSKEKMRKINVFAMTATPGNSIKQWLKLLSIVRRADQLAFTTDNDTGKNAKGNPMCEHSAAKDDAKAIEGLLKKALQNDSSSQKYLELIKAHVNRNYFGLVSYVDIRSDMSRHACVEEVMMPVQMDKDYFLILLKINREERGKVNPTIKREIVQHQYDPGFPNTYMNLMRKRGDVLTKALYAKHLPASAIAEMRKNNRFLRTTAQHVRLVSPKFAKLAEFVATKPGKHYVYLLHPNNDILATALVAWFKMVNVTALSDQFNSAHADKVTKKIVGMKPSPLKSNFIVLGDTTHAGHRARLIDIFNSPDNADGSYIRAVLVSGQLYEGLDLTALRYVSLGDVLASPLQESQAIGRGVRNCSHRGLPLKDRRVTVVRWFSAAPKGSWESLAANLAAMKGIARGRTRVEHIKQEYDRLKGRSYDEDVFLRSRKDPDFNILSNFERIMKTAALDCTVLAPFHPGSSCSVAKLSRSNPLSAGTRCAA